MASTYSSLKIQLMTTGENLSTWGIVTNTNLGTTLEEAIAGSADVAFSSADVTLTLSDSNATQAARNMRLNLTGTSGGARNLLVPAIEKMYVVNNGLADACTVKVSGQTGIAVPAGKTMLLFNNGTDVLNAITHLSSLTLATDLALTEGGTGASSASAARTNLGLVIGTDVQAYDAQLTDISGLAVTNGNFIVGDGSNWVAESGATLRTSAGLGTTNDVQFDSFGVGTAASGTTGEIRATNNVTAYYSSDARLKENVTPIGNAVDIVKQLNGVRYDWTASYIESKGGEDGMFVRKHDIGVIAQEVEKVFPEIVAENSEGYKAVRYERLVPVLIEAVKELSREIERLKGDK